MPSRYRRAHMLLKVATYTSYASWVFVAALLLSSHFNVPYLPTISMFACVICVATSLVSDEVALRIYNEDHGGWGIAMMVAAVGLALGAIVSFALGAEEAMGTCVILLFVLSFAPTVLDGLGVGEDFDEDDYERRYAGGHTSDMGFDPLDLLGMGSPKTPPPIVIEQGEDLDDDWKQYLGVEESETEDEPEDEDEYDNDDIEEIEIIGIASKPEGDGNDDENDG